MDRKWTVELWSGAAWVRVCTESSEENGRLALREVAQYNMASKHRLLGPDGMVIQRLPAREATW